MKAPARYAGAAIEHRLCVPETLEWPMMKSWENKLAVLWQAAQQALRLRGQRNDMCSPVLGACPWNSPCGEVARYLAPCHASNLIAALAGQNEHAHYAIERPRRLRCYT